ncbi:MAG: hypothetical protein HXY34_03905 [Candidatus Thorarchaeota archaeon]|nr:hypothetical protein [Candidatus Thorarchaeota archaeon]
MMRSSPLFWLLDVEAYDYMVGFLKDAELRGKALILSSQLWSIIRGDQVVSILIGPGTFKGSAQSGSRKLDILEPLSALMFDPTQLRYDEPVPTVDIVHPEVIDPLEKRKVDEIVTHIRHVIVERGHVLAGDMILKVNPGASVPVTAHALDMVQRVNVSHVSGVQRAKFILAGTNQPLYRPLVEGYSRGKYARADMAKVMAVPFSKFCSFADIEVMSDWMIVEKAGLDTKTGIEAMEEEYNLTLADIKKNADAFIFQR